MNFIGCSPGWKYENDNHCPEHLLLVWYHDHANKKVAAFLGQRLKLSKSTVFLVPKTMGIGGFFKNFGKCPKMAHFGQNLA